MSNEAIFSATSGGLAGGILGKVFEDELNVDGNAAAIGAGIGALAGLTWGSYYFSVQQEKARDQLPLKRVGIEIPDPQGDTLDAAIEDQSEATKWGRGEIRSWEERYMDHDDNLPYQGF